MYVCVKYDIDMHMTIASYGCETNVDHCRNVVSYILLYSSIHSSIQYHK